MDSFTVSFFGHRKVCNVLHIEAAIEKNVKKLLSEKPYVEFLVGRDGEFDILVASVIRRQKREYRSDNSSLIWILPYPTSDYHNNEMEYRSYYDEIEISEGSHYKSAHRIRNRKMIDRSDMVICYVEHNSGGAYQALRYAQEKGKKVVNLAEEMGAL